jgi:prolyl-tRNA editing enzyme YbaK/EbsC (Cys-tRNA(Pro) deacylase)
MSPDLSHGNQSGIRKGVISLLNQELLDHIKAGGFPFELLKNERRIRSSEEGAAYWKIHIGQTAPALILRADNRFLLLVISGAVARVDLKTLASSLGVASLRMATPQEIKENFDLKPGDIPLVGLDLHTLIDRRLMAYDFIYGGSGDVGFTLKISPRALPFLNGDHQLVDIPSLSERN